MAKQDNALTASAKMLAAQVKPGHFVDHWFGGLVYTRAKRFSTEVERLAADIIGEVPAGNRGILIDQARSMGSTPVEVFEVLLRRDEDARANTRALTSCLTMACIIAAAHDIVCAGPYTTEEYALANA